MIFSAAAVTFTARAEGSGGGVDGFAPRTQSEQIDYMLKCQGCHQPDGRGNSVNTPPLAGQVAKFLHVPGGREFLVQVPGVATTDLDDVRVARLLNWMLPRFDPQHMPAGFAPYTASEVAALRKQPLRLERAKTRAGLIFEIERQASTR